MIPKRRVVVTGLGLVTALGLEVGKNWTMVLSGTSGITAVSLPDAPMCPIQAVGQVKQSDWRKIEDTFKADSSAVGERKSLLALWAAESAAQDAGLHVRSGESARCGVVMAAGLGINRIEDIHRWVDTYGRFDLVRFGKELAQVHAESIIRNHSNRASSLIAKQFGFTGPNCTVTSACASATQAIGMAYRSISRGDADIMVCGGADSMINPVGLVFFVLLNVAAVSSKSPETLCRPFDRKRSGLVVGEGAGIVVLEECARAQKRGATIYGEVCGYGSSLDAHNIVSPHPEGRGAAQSMRVALRDAKIGYDEIDYINAHGTGTKLNDAAETNAIKSVFGEGARSICISSSKSMIGHLMAAAGGPEFIYTVLSVRNDEIHPTINLHHPDPVCDLDYVPNRKRSKTVRAALSNSFGFGGQNATLAVRKFVI